MDWKDLDFWKSGEWQVIEEKLDALDKRQVVYNPDRSLLFRSMDVCPFDDCRVAIFGQDPYPTRTQACGLAFSMPSGYTGACPPTLDNILKEYVNDLHYDFPTNWDLLPWAKQGVFLWNVVPVCLEGQPLSCDWPEWEFLNAEIVEKLSKKGAVLVFLGGVARRYTSYVSDSAETLEFSHPSPRGSLKSRTPFTGSRMFSTINAKLVSLSKGVWPIEWRL